MKKKRIEALPPIQLRETRKKPYLAVASVEDICGQSHLIIDVYEGKRHIRRAAYTENDWGLWEPGGQWNGKRIGESAPEWDVYDMISGPGLPDKAKWSNTGIDDQSKEVIKKFVMDAAKAAGKYVSPIAGRCWEYYPVKLEEIILDARREKCKQNCLDRLYERCEDMPKLPQDLGKWADRALYFNREYVYYKRKGRKATCQCSKCGGEYTIITRRRDGIDGMLETEYPVPVNNAQTSCVLCGTTATYKPEGRCKYIYGERSTAYVLQPFRTGTVIRYLDVRKEWGVGCKSALFWQEKARIFRIEGREFVDWNTSDRYREESWDYKNYLGYGYIQLMNGEVFTGNTDEWNTPELKYTGLKEFIQSGCHGRMKPQAYLDACRKWPMERIVKLGLYHIAEKLMDYHSLGISEYKHHAKIQSVLRIRRCRLGLICSYDTVRMLSALQAEKWSTENAALGKAKGKGAWTEEQVLKADAMSIDLSYTDVLRYVSIEQLINRVEKWIGKEVRIGGDPKAAQKAAFYRDYIEMRIEHGYDMTRSTSLYPRDLNAAHMEIVKAVEGKKEEGRAKEYEKQYPEFRKQYRKLKARYSYKADGLFIRPAKTIMEIIEEGRFLHHCVGSSDTYIKRHANGETAILFLRDALEPNVPYITVEVKGKSILQWHGRNDTKPDKDRIGAFLKKWLDDVTEREKPKQSTTTEKVRTDLAAAG